MKCIALASFFFAFGTALFCAHAEEHHATRLGNPTTRFAPPVTSPEDLRSRFRDENLKRDMEAVLREWGWTGRPEDLFRASQTAEIRDVNISVGAKMPFMSSRENGKPICLRNVTWAGQEPAPAYLFNFTSNGRRYRCVTPKACCNFYVEDLGLVPVPALALECRAPSQAYPKQPVEVCLTVNNPGTGPAAKVNVRLPIPQGASVSSVSPGGIASQQEVTWDLANLSPKASEKLCVRMSALTPGLLTFASTASASNVKPVQSLCSTKVVGIPAVLVEVVDLDDPIEVGSDVVYETKVTNQGSAEVTNLRVEFKLPPSEEFRSGSGPTMVRQTDSSVLTDPLPSLAPKAQALWRVTVKAKQPGDARFKSEVTSAEFTNPIRQEESTRLY